MVCPSGLWYYITAYPYGTDPVPLHGIIMLIIIALLFEEIEFCAVMIFTL
jgi:hypothetical protein